MIQVQNLSFSYNHFPILKNIDFSAESGKITAIIGSNGVGKTTLLKCIAGIQKYSGNILLDGTNLKSISEAERAKRIGYLCQESVCNAQLTVFEVILSGMAGTLSMRVSKQDVEKVNAAMETMGISHLANRKIYQLSGGQQQLVFIAQALVKEPEVLILDEPTSALDMNRQFQLMDVIHDLTGSRNLTTILCLHHLNLVSQYANQVIVLGEGTVYRAGTPEAVLTEQMFQQIYAVQTEFYLDQNGTRHVIPTQRIL